MASGISCGDFEPIVASGNCGDAALQFDPFDSREIGEVVFKILTDPALQKSWSAKATSTSRNFPGLIQLAKPCNSAGSFNKGSANNSGWH